MSDGSDETHEVVHVDPVDALEDLFESVERVVSLHDIDETLSVALARAHQALVERHRRRGNGRVDRE